MTFELKGILKVATAVFLLILLTSCGLGSAQKGRKPSPDWSRGVPLNVAVAGTADMIVAENGETLHLAWPSVLDDELVIHYLQLDQTAEPVVDRDLELPPGRARTPHLLLADNGQLHLTWARRPEGSSGWELWQAMLDTSGNVLETNQLSTADMNVSDYATAQPTSGQAYVVWEDNETDGIFGMRLGETADPMLLVEEGIAPSIQLDDNNNLHLSWVEGNTIYYDTLANGNLATVQGKRVVDMELQPTDTLGGPVLGLTEDLGYLVWSRYIATGLESDTGRTDYVAFALDNPVPLAAPERLSIMPVEEQPYEPYEGNYALTTLAPPPPIVSMGSNYTIQPSVAAGRGNEVALSVATQQQIRLNDFVQMAVAVFKDGRFEGYEIAAKTEGFSQEGTLAADASGNLHLIWREGAGGRRLYYATTNPTLKAALDSLTGEDWATAAFSGIFEGATGIAFFPLALLWLLPGGLILGIRQLRTEDETVTNFTAYALLALSLVLYQTTKALVLPTVLSYVPYSAWIEVPVSWELPLRIGYPLLTFVIGLAAAEWLRRKRPSTSTLLYFFTVAAIDAVLTLGVYGVAFLGNF
jgi:hypothetical protein